MQSTAVIASYITDSPYARSLYARPSFALGILRLFDSKTTQLVFSLLCNSIHITRLEELSGYQNGLRVLEQLKIITITDNVISLSETYGSALISGLCEASQECFLITMPQSERSAIPAISYDRAKEISQKKFKRLLGLIVNKVAERERSISQLLLFANLVDESGSITNKGFEFLLQSRSEQQWHIVLCAVRFFAQNIEEELDLLCVVMEVCMKGSGTVCEIKEWMDWYDLMESVGVLHYINDGKQRAMFINDDFFSQSSSEITKNRFMILETNFKIYAYTSQLYERSILNLFSEAVYVLPNLVKAQFSEKAARVAFEKGITANQIIRYLKNYSSGVPANVGNQLIIWENSRKRIKESKGVLYTDFNHLSDFIKFRSMLDRKKAVLHCDERRRIIIAKEEAYEEAREFLKGLK